MCMLTYACSKKTRIQSQNLAAAILEGLMPIGTEAEPEDGDDEVPSRVRSFMFPHIRWLLTELDRLLSGLSIRSPPAYLPVKSSHLSGISFCSICRILIRTIVDVL